MNSLEFKKLGLELQQLAKTTPLQWGKIQNNTTDNKVNLFDCNSLEVLEKSIIDLNNTGKSYFRRRWFLWQCAKCDEYLFYKNTNVTRNPNRKSKDFDIEFFENSNLRFDVKSTVVPKAFRRSFNFENPKPLIDFYYNKQSKGQRNYVQNRLFVIHYSFISEERTLFLRCAWQFKKSVYSAFIAQLSMDTKFIKYKDVLTATIFIIEQQDGSLTYRFA